MHYMVSGQQKNFFNSNGWVVFAELFSEDAAASYARSLRLAIEQRLQVHRGDVAKAGFRVSRGVTALWKGISAVAISRVAADLLGRTPLRFGYDMALWGGVAPIPEGATLEEVSSYQGVLGAAAFILEPLEEIEQEDTEEDEEPSFVPTEAGDVLFLKPDTPLPFSILRGMEKGLVLLVVYIEGGALYHPQEQDPNRYFLKQHDYAVGDKVRDDLHPTLFR